MSTYPVSPRSDFLEWCQSHAPVFEKNADAIGMTLEQAMKFGSLTGEAAKAILEQEAAQQAARVATRRARDAVAALQAGAGDAVRTIRATAELNSYPNKVYNTAQIAPPADPSPTPPPDKPRRLDVTLVAATGALTLTWKASNPRGTSGTAYVIRRRLPGETAFSYLGVTGEKRFVDETVPTGVERVEYTVQGQRGRRAGPMSEILLVMVGQVGTRRDSRTGIGGDSRTGDVGLPASVSSPRDGLVQNSKSGRVKTSG